MYFARLRPFSREQEYLKRTHISTDGTVWHAGVGMRPSDWAEVTEGMANELLSIGQFEVRECTLYELERDVTDDVHKSLLRGEFVVRPAIKTSTVPARDMSPPSSPTDEIAPPMTTGELDDSISRPDVTTPSDGDQDPMTPRRDLSILEIIKDDANRVDLTSPQPVMPKPQLLEKPVIKKPTPKKGGKPRKRR